MLFRGRREGQKIPEKQVERQVAALDMQPETHLDAQPPSKPDAQVNKQLDTQVDIQVDTQVDTQVVKQVDKQVDSGSDSDERSSGDPLDDPSSDPSANPSSDPSNDTPNDPSTNTYSDPSTSAPSDPNKNPPSKQPLPSSKPPGIPVDLSPSKDPSNESSPFAESMTDGPSAASKADDARLSTHHWPGEGTQPPSTPATQAVTDPPETTDGPLVDLFPSVALTDPTTDATKRVEEQVKFVVYLDDRKYPPATRGSLSHGVTEVHMPPSAEDPRPSSESTLTSASAIEANQTRIGDDDVIDLSPMKLSERQTQLAIETTIPSSSSYSSSSSSSTTNSSSFSSSSSSSPTPSMGNNVSDTRDDTKSHDSTTTDVAPTVQLSRSPSTPAAISAASTSSGDERTTRGESKGIFLSTSTSTSSSSSSSSSSSFILFSSSRDVADATPLVTAEHKAPCYNNNNSSSSSTDGAVVFWLGFPVFWWVVVAAVFVLLMAAIISCWTCVVCSKRKWRKKNHQRRGYLDDQLTSSFIQSYSNPEVTPSSRNYNSNNNSSSNSNIKNGKIHPKPKKSNGASKSPYPKSYHLGPKLLPFPADAVRLKPSTSVPSSPMAGPNFTRGPNGPSTCEEESKIFAGLKATVQPAEAAFGTWRKTGFGGFPGGYKRPSADNLIEGEVEDRRSRGEDDVFEEVEEEKKQQVLSANNHANNNNISGKNNNTNGNNNNNNKNDVALTTFKNIHSGSTSTFKS